MFTRRWVVELILDLAGYRSDDRLFDHVAVDPACGDGAFVVAMVDRLAASCTVHGVDIADAHYAIRALDIDETAVRRARVRVVTALTDRGVGRGRASALAREWVGHRDFLLTAEELSHARWVVGNPPYVRIEDAAAGLMARYRERWPTMTGRADTYVGFMEAGLSVLAPGGKLAYICPDRWMRNRYGHRLRALIEESYAVDVCVSMHGVDAFDERVAAYPAITVIRVGPQGEALVADALPHFDERGAINLVGIFERGRHDITTTSDFRACWRTDWFHDVESWSPDVRGKGSAIAELEARLPSLEEAGITISVGVATGADDVFIVDEPGDIERDRLIPVIGAKEILSGRVESWERWLVNPWGEHGLVDLECHPGLAKYMRTHADRLKARYVAREHPNTWWRTIDRVRESVSGTPKLLIPDVKDRIHPVLDAGEFYPMHNLYYAVAPTWNPELLTW